MEQNSNFETMSVAIFLVSLTIQCFSLILKRNYFQFAMPVVVICSLQAQAGLQQILSLLTRQLTAQLSRQFFNLTQSIAAQKFCSVKLWGYTIPTELSVTSIVNWLNRGPTSDTINTCGQKKERILEFESINNPNLLAIVNGLKKVNFYYLFHKK